VIRGSRFAVIFGDLANQSLILAQGKLNRTDPGIAHLSTFPVRIAKVEQVLLRDAANDNTVVLCDSRKSKTKPSDMNRYLFI
jgi:hypothetical protein